MTTPQSKEVTAAFINDEAKNEKLSMVYIGPEDSVLY